MKIILVGKAGSGKDFMRDWLSNVEILDVSYTTRPPRIGEIDGYTYHFVNEHHFKNLEENNFFFEKVRFAGFGYGTSKINWESKTVFIMTPSGVLSIPETDREQCVIVYMDVPIDIRRARLSRRSDFDSVARRINADEEDFKDFKDFNIRVTNPNFDPESLYTTILTYAKCNHIK